MALAQSAIALAANGLSESLENKLADVHVIVDTPAAASKTAAATADKHFLNIFFYRIAHSGFHAAQTADDPLFIRIFALLTPFAKKAPANGEDYPNLRILGEVLQHFHEHPVSGVLQTQHGANGTQYRIQATLQAPNMEELNHIWTTQGSDLSYQLSAAYEFSLVPVDPEVMPSPPSQVMTTMMQVEPDLKKADEKPVTYDLEFKSRPGLTEAEEASWAGRPHLPQFLALGPQGQVTTVDLAAAANKVDLVLAGSVGAKAHITLKVLNAAGGEIRTSSAAKPIAATRLDEPGAKVTLPVNLAGGAKSVVAELRAADNAGVPLAPNRVAATLTLTVGGGA